MAIEEQILSEISRSVARVSDSSESFRTTASQQNSNIQRVIKDISGMFRAQSASQAEMASSIDELNDQMAKANEKNEGVASSLSETIAVQNSMLNELQGIGQGIDSLTNMIMMMLQQNSGGGGGGALTSLGSMGGATSSLLMKTLGLAGAAGLGVGAANVLGSSPGSSGGQTSNIMAALRHQESGSAEGDYKAQNPDTSASGAYGFTDDTWKDATAAARIGQKYEHAKDAPKNIQDEVAQKRVEYLLEKVGGDVNQLPVMWHGGVSRANAPNMVNASDEKYRTEWSQKYQQVAQQQSSQEPAATQTSASSPNTSDDFKEFLARKSEKGVNADKLNPDFAKRLMLAIQAAEQATGETVSITSGFRTPEQQAQQYANYIGKTYNYNGKPYYPNPDEPRPSMAAEPGHSAHETGDAVDLGKGAARDYIMQNAAKFGLQDLPGDPPHISDKAESSGGSTNTAGQSNLRRELTGLVPSAPEPQGESLMAGLGMPAGMGPSSEPRRIGMGDMDSYNPLGVLGALSGGNMFGPSGQVGAAGAAISVLGAAASQFEPSQPDTRGARLNQAAVNQKAETAAPWINPDATPPQQPTQQSTPQQQSSPREVNQDTYNHPNDRNVSVSWMDKILGIYPKETSGVNQTWID